MASPSGAGDDDLVVAGTGNGRGAPGLRRKKRRYGEPSFHISIRLHQEERDALVAISEARNCTASVVISELLIEEARRIAR